MAVLVGAAVCGLGLRRVLAFREDRGEIECTERVAALVRASVCRLGLGQVATLLK